MVDAIYSLRQENRIAGLANGLGNEFFLAPAAREGYSSYEMRFAARVDLSGHFLRDGGLFYVVMASSVGNWAKF